MTEKNYIEVMFPHEIPTMDFIIKRQFKHFEDLKKTILLKEILFKNSVKQQEIFELYSIQIEKELGELYAELMESVKYYNLFPNE